MIGLTFLCQCIGIEEGNDHGTGVKFSYRNWLIRLRIDRSLNTFENAHGSYLRKFL